MPPPVACLNQGRGGGGTEEEEEEEIVSIFNRGYF